ncbi:ABC transporter substrate-binding protein [Mangrovactinospora gilvigrisea]|uniref:ABC transporter substrate-binding protein n=1 Tax=Mangrovactinospora gilvigrisea TaxID=1428644 RepID=A0A1J7BBM2_9ACTN|nr:MCE family protein [Mangrovactinospora gilvigrisea]OIV36030.1 ABC transporter substrate-binding protein [Mangrovactinospora gilvigrisea]
MGLRMRIRPGLLGPLIKSIVFIVVTGLATAGLGYAIADTATTGTVHYHARFSDVTGLLPGDSIRIAGVSVGRVDGIHVVDHRVARVDFSLQKGHPLPAGATASVKYLNLVGQRYIELDRGSAPVGDTLATGATIPLARTSPALDLTQLFDGFRPLFQGLSPKDTNELAGEIIQVLQGEGGTVDSLLTHIGSLTTDLASRDKQIGEVIDNLNKVLATVNTRESGLNELIGTLKQLVSGFNTDRQPLGEAVTAMASLTTTTAGLLNDGRSPLKSDIDRLGGLATNLDAAEPQITSFLTTTPEKMTAIARTVSYGSWLNAYLCQATVTGVTTSTGEKPPTGVTGHAARCGS